MQLLMIYIQQLLLSNRGRKVKKKKNGVRIHLHFLQLLSEISFIFNSLILQELILVKNMDFTPQSTALVQFPPTHLKSETKFLQRLGSVSELLNSVLFLYHSILTIRVLQCFIILFDSFMEVFLLIFINSSLQTSEHL